MECPECNNEMELTDTTYSTITTKRCNKGDHTGDIYYCKICEKHWIDDFLNRDFHEYSYY